MHTPSHAAPSDQPPLVHVGGFLGAGKTTAIARLGALLRKMGRTAAVITATAGSESVDALRLRELGFPVLDRTEIRATKEGTRFVEWAGDSLAREALPLSVVVDPTRAVQVFGLEPGPKLIEPIGWLYRKQIQQGSLLLINRADSIPRARLQALRDALRAEAPDAQVLELSSATDRGLEEWWECLKNKPTPAPAVAIVPQMLGQARRSLGTLNCAVQFSTVRYFDGDKLLLELGALIQNILRHENGEVAHLKMFLKPTDGVSGFSTAHVNSNVVPPSLWESLPEPIQVGRMVLNLRAVGDPELLHSATNRALLAIVEKFPEIFARLEYSEHFRPEA